MRVKFARNLNEHINSRSNGHPLALYFIITTRNVIICAANGKERLFWIYGKAVLDIRDNCYSDPDYYCVQQSKLPQNASLRYTTVKQMFVFLQRNV